MALVKRTLKNLIVAGTAFVLTAPLCPAIAGDTLPPPPPDEDNPTPVVPKTYTRTYDKKPAAQTTTTTTTTTAVTEPAATTATTTSTSATTTTAATTVPTRPVNAALIPILTKAYAEMSKGAYEQARNHFMDAVKIDSNSITSRRYLAYVLVRTSQPSDALTQLLVISRMMKPTPFDRQVFGEAYLATGNIPNAIESFSEALKTDPGNHAARGGLIKALCGASKYAEAGRECQEGIRNAAFIKDAKTRQKTDKYYQDLFKYIYQAKTTGTPAPNADYVQPQQVAPNWTPVDFEKLVQPSHG